MIAYIIKRLIWVPITVILVSMLVFIMVRFIPGSIIDTMVAELQVGSSVPIDRHAIAVSLGLDKPIYVQYAHWVGGIILHGSLGNSLKGSQNISQAIMGRLPVTMELTIIALIISVIIAIPIAVYAAVRQETVADYIGRSLAIVLISVPSFWIGTMIMIYPALWWHWSPILKYVPFTKDPLHNLEMFIIPSLVLGTALAGSTMRMVRTMMLEVLRQDYTRTAWAKGLTERVIVIRHALKNALIPVVTVIGMQIPFLVSGAVIIEEIFVLPGIGRYLMDSLQNRDYPTVEGINLVLATFVIIINLLVDVTYGWLDPRIHHQ